MCTLSFIPEEHGYVLTMNRDEQRNREEGGLEVKKSTDGHYAYPLDILGGGTWVGLNHQGTSVALLNRYNAPTIDNAISRGLIVREALALGGVEQASAYINHLNIERYNPFDCLVVGADEKLHHFSWDRERFLYECRKADKPFMLTSSSLLFDQVRAHRQERFDTWNKDFGDSCDVDMFHLEQIASQESFAVLMSRERTHTKSVVQIQVNSRQAQLNYFDESVIAPNTRLKDMRLTASHVFSGEYA